MWAELSCAERVHVSLYWRAKETSRLGLHPGSPESQARPTAGDQTRFSENFLASRPQTLPHPKLWSLALDTAQKMRCEDTTAAQLAAHSRTRGDFHNFCNLSAHERRPRCTDRPLGGLQREIQLIEPSESILKFPRHIHMTATKMHVDVSSRNSSKHHLYRARVVLNNP